MFESWLPMDSEPFRKRNCNVRIGVISDTHGLLRPEVEQRLAGVAHIVHVGDIGSPNVIAGLQRSLRSEGTSIPATGRSNTRVTMLYAWRTSDAPTKLNW